MFAKGRVVNGAVVLEEGTSLPEGAEVIITLHAVPAAASEQMSEAQRREIMEILDRIAALPDENPGDTFSGADHDRVLYGKR